MYTTIPFVNYWRLKKGKKPVHKNYVCFGQMAGGDTIPDAIRYVAPISEKMNREAMDFYLAFMVRVLRRPESPKFLLRKFKDKVIYRLETKGLTYIHSLFYLSWFRYIHEFPEIPNELFLRKKEGDDDNALLIKFQEIHDEVVKGKFRLSYNGISGHGLRYNYAGYGGEPCPPITLDRLVENIKSKPSTVHGYFK